MRRLKKSCIKKYLRYVLIKINLKLLRKIRRKASLADKFGTIKITWSVSQQLTM